MLQGHENNHNFKLKSAPHLDCQTSPSCCVQKLRKLRKNLGIGCYKYSKVSSPGFHKSWKYLFEARESLADEYGALTKTLWPNFTAFEMYNIQKQALTSESAIKLQIIQQNLVVQLVCKLLILDLSLPITCKFWNNTWPVYTDLLYRCFYFSQTCHGNAKIHFFSFFFSLDAVF